MYVHTLHICMYIHNIYVCTYITYVHTLHICMDIHYIYVCTYIEIRFLLTKFSTSANFISFIYSQGDQIESIIAQWLIAFIIWTVFIQKWYVQVLGYFFQGESDALILTKMIGLHFG
jgi:hypothetical protein